jgi:hypothetical protein
VVDPESATRAAEEATRAERTRATTIRSLVKGQKLGDELADDLITRGVQLDGPGGARDVVLTKLAERDAKVVTDNHVRIEQGDDARDKFIRGASAWLFEKGGVGATLKAAKERGVKALASLELDGGEFRGMSLKDLARESLDRAGVKTRGMSQMDMVGLAFTSRGGMQTTSDFAVLFENVMGKILLGAYAITPDTWSLICKTDTVPDFRPSPRYRSGSLTALDSLNEHGEFKNKVIPDGLKTAITVGTKGNIIALTRQAIINDDMSALADLPQKLGRASKMSIEIDFYTLLALNSGLGPTQSDAQPFFHANRANVNASATAITLAGIDADRVVMAAQKDISSNDFLDLKPRTLLVSSSQGSAARTINDAMFDPADNKFQKPNVVKGLFSTVVDTPRYTGTRRYLFADPAIAPAFVVAFLEGQGESPVLETQNGWRIDGTEWKVRMDYKVQEFDPKGAVTNAGA